MFLTSIYVSHNSHPGLKVTPGKLEIDILFSACHCTHITNSLVNRTSNDTFVKKDPVFQNKGDIANCLGVFVF